MGKQSGWFPWWRVERASAWGHAMVSRRARHAQRVERLGNEHIRDMELIMAAVLRRRSNCVDVGAHGGSMLRRMLRVAPDGQHIAVEPIPELADRLRLKFPLVTVHEAALSDRAGSAEFKVIDDDLALSGFQPRANVPTGMRPIPSRCAPFAWTMWCRPTNRWISSRSTWRGLSWPCFGAQWKH